MVSHVHREPRRLPQLRQQPQQHGVLGAGRENNNNVAVRRRDALQPEPLGGEEVASAGDLLLEELGGCGKGALVAERRPTELTLLDFFLGALDQLAAT